MYSIFYTHFVLASHEEVYQVPNRNTGHLLYIVLYILHEYLFSFFFFSVTSVWVILVIYNLLHMNKM